MATGNDWRAIEAGAHAYAARGGRYTVALAVGAGTRRRPGRHAGDADGGGHRRRGDARSPTVPGVALKILGVQTARELAEIVAAVGLAQNLAALRALATEGIQRGHMRLHARQVAMAAGAKRRRDRAGSRATGPGAGDPPGPGAEYWSASRQVYSCDMTDTHYAYVIAIRNDETCQAESASWVRRLCARATGCRPPKSPACGRAARAACRSREKAVPGLDEDTVTMALEAARNALARARVDPQDIGAVWVGSESHPYAVKPTSTIVAEAIGATPFTQAADWQFACKAGTEAMQAAIGLVGSGMARYALGDRRRHGPGPARRCAGIHRRGRRRGLHRRPGEPKAWPSSRPACRM